MFGIANADDLCFEISTSLSQERVGSHGGRAAAAVTVTPLFFFLSRTYFYWRRVRDCGALCRAGAWVRWYPQPLRKDGVRCFAAPSRVSAVVGMI